MNEQYRSNQVTNHLNTKNWLIVNRKQLKKAIAELAHEELIQPKLKKEEGTSYILYADDTNIYYEFDAQILILDHWCID
ncbi:MAG: hypothetical protein JKY03_00260, partial [Aureispira sp.]|nr:hypothetical protein [Aureispira sp.]